MTKNEFVVLCIDKAIEGVKKTEIMGFRGFITNQCLELYVRKKKYEYVNKKFDCKNILNKNDEFELTYLEYLKLRTQMKRGIVCQFVGVGNTN